MFGLYKAGLTRISNGFHFVNIIVVDDVIESGVEFVEEIHDLVGRAGAGELSEAHYVTGHNKQNCF